MGFIFLSALIFLYPVYCGQRFDISVILNDESLLNLEETSEIIPTNMYAVQKARDQDEKTKPGFPRLAVCRVPGGLKNLVTEIWSVKVVFLILI